MTARSLSLILLVIATPVATLHAAPRPWKSADGQRSVKGEFVKRDATTVTILRSDRKQVAIPLDQLHADDRTWLNANHPPAGEEASPPAAIFDKLEFGDTRAQVIEKLNASKFVEATVAETFFGRTGLNGVYRTRKKIGGLDTSLYFGWTEEGRLEELILQTPGMPPSAIKDQGTNCWKELIELLTTLHGKPTHENNELKITSIEDGSMSGTHLWKLDTQGSAMLGAAREGDEYQIAVRFTREEIAPVPTP
jgi:hypothetical protein